MPDLLDRLESELTDLLPPEHHQAVFATVDRIRADYGGDRHYIGQRSRDRRNRLARQLRGQGETIESIAEKLGCGKATASRITRKPSGFL